MDRGAAEMGGVSAEMGGVSAECEIGIGKWQNVSNERWKV